MKKLTKRERAIEICKNLTQTINKMKGSMSIEHKNETFERSVELNVRSGAKRMHRINACCKVCNCF